ncbi:MAG: Na+/H+ antiporter NhaC family protein, partial [Gemmatimonadota bacterium]
MRLTRLAPVALLLALPLGAAAQQLGDTPDVVLSGIPFQITVEGGAEPTPFEILTRTGEVLSAGFVPPFESVTEGGLVVASGAELPLTVTVGGTTTEVDPTLTPGWFSLVPPLVAILLALIFREVVSALFVGVWVGALAIAGFNPIVGTWRLIDQLVIPEIANTADGHTHIIVFSLLLGGMVGVMSRCGGTMGIVEAVRPFARTARRGQLATWLAGMGVFFDDYANTLIVGNTMRPITDALRISREKLAYLVDCTAAPLAAIVPISTWVGYEISLIRDGLSIAAEQNPDMAASLDLNALTVFVETIPYRFYPVLALFFAAMVALTKRDFGPMAEAERRARHAGHLHRPDAQLLQDTATEGIQAKAGVRHRWWNAALPVATVVVVVLAGLYTTGRAGAGPDAGLWDVFGNSDPFTTMAWGAL